MIQYLFHIGPLDGTNDTDGRIAYFLYPGVDGQTSFFANTLGDVLPLIMRHIPRAELRIEPGLATEAEELGLPVEDLPKDTRDLLGLIAFDIADRQTFAAIETDDLISLFAAAASAFQNADPGAWPENNRTLRISDLDTGEWSLARVLPDPGLAILDTPEVVGDPADWDGIGAVFAETEPALTDALERAFGLHGLPQPFRVENGTKRPVDDFELAMLCASLHGASQLDGTERVEAMSTVSAGAIKKSVKLTFAVR